MTGAAGHFGPHRLIRRMISNRAAARAWAKRILLWDFDRIIVAHGDGSTAAAAIACVSPSPICRARAAAYSSARGFVCQGYPADGFYITTRTVESVVAAR
jgi:hypothetical protein